MDQAAPDVASDAAGSSRARPRIPIAREGWPFIAGPLVAAGLLALLGRRRAAALVALPGLASLGFFRDPERTVPAVAGALLAPADGRVMGIAHMEDRWVGPATRVSIFLSPLDVHVNRAPIAGVVRAVEWVPGRFVAAYRPEASEDNERCTLSLESEQMRVSVSQIAGVVARRIVCRARPGDALAAGERYGLIRFGSRTDLTMPRAADLRVQVGDRVTGGESIMAVMA